MIGANIGFHDSSICHLLLEGREIKNVEIILSERVSRRKNDGGFPFSSFRHIQKTNPNLWSSIGENEIILNCLGEHPAETEKLMRSEIEDYDTLIEAFRLQKASSLYNPNINFITHHLAHAYSLYQLMPFDKAIIVVADGAGSEKSAFRTNDLEWEFVKNADEGREYLSVYKFEEGNFTPLIKQFTSEKFHTPKMLRLSKSLGSPFEFAAKLLFNNWKQAGKVMGLSAYGSSQSVEDINDFLLGLDITRFKTFKTKQEFDSQPTDAFQLSADVAATIQSSFEKSFMDLMLNLRASYPDFENVVLVGGCALNGLFNMKLVKKGIFKNVFVPPFPNDEGIALGSVLKLAKDKNRIDFKVNPIELIHPYWGPSANDVSLLQENVPKVFKDFSVVESQNITDLAAELIGDNQIVAWMQGRSEVGPRALGNRSILCRPDIPGIKDHLNDYVKYRERFRPYGATVLKELAHEYFDVDEHFHSPFMTFCANVKPQYREKLAGVTHVDGTCRIQTLCETQNVQYYKLIKKCHENYGLAVVLNTSLNLMDQPIVESLEDALYFFENSKIKYMIIGSYLIRK